MKEPVQEILENRTYLKQKIFLKVSIRIVQILSESLFHMDPMPVKTTLLYQSVVLAGPQGVQNAAFFIEHDSRTPQWYQGPPWIDYIACDSVLLQEPVQYILHAVGNV